MNRLQKIQKAKSYMDMLSKEINPISGENSECDLTKNSEMKEIFSFVASLLGEIIENGGEVVSVSKPVAFSPGSINKNRVYLSESPVSIETLTLRINKQVNKNFMKNLGASKIKNWLIANGYASVEKIQVIKNENSLRLTENSEKIGIIETSKTDSETGEIKSKLMLSLCAQEYILENLEDICAESKNFDGEDVTDELEV